MAKGGKQNAANPSTGSSLAEGPEEDEKHPREEKVGDQAKRSTSPAGGEATDPAESEEGSGSEDGNGDSSEEEEEGAVGKLRNDSGLMEDIMLNVAKKPLASDSTLQPGVQTFVVDFVVDELKKAARSGRPHRLGLWIWHSHHEERARKFSRWSLDCLSADLV